MTLSELQQIVFDAGVVGAGGAGFPTHKKFSKDVKQIVVNASECEPLLMTDHHILKKHFRSLIDTLYTLMQVMEVEEAFIGIKEKNVGLMDPEIVKTLPENIKIRTFPDIYPAGDEVVLVYETTGKIIPEGCVPVMIGVMVINVETLYNIHCAMDYHKPVYEKHISIGGDTKESITVKPPIGMKIKDVLKTCGIDAKDRAVIAGGPMMGKLVDLETAVITKTTKGLLLFPETHSVIQRRKMPISVTLKQASAACCNCQMCTDVCPRHLLGYSIHVDKTLRAASHGEVQNADSFLEASLCCGCGICTVIGCQQMLNPQAIATAVKGELAKQGYRRKPSEEAPKPRPERESRFVSSDRLIDRLGIRKYVKEKIVRQYIEFHPDRVEIPLSQHLGKPADPIVSVGTKVTCGTPIAKTSPDALGTTIHASIDGIVTEITASAIVISAN